MGVNVAMHTSWRCGWLPARSASRHSTTCAAKGDQLLACVSSPDHQCHAGGAGRHTAPNLGGAVPHHCREQGENRASNSEDMATN